MDFISRRLKKRFAKNKDGERIASHGMSSKRSQKPMKSGIFESSTEPPSRVDLRRYCSPVENQSQSNSCCANAAVGAYEYLCWREAEKNGDTPGDISRLFVYYIGRLRDKQLFNEASPLADEGMTLTGAIDALTMKGACLQSSWPFELDNINSSPPEEAFLQAMHYKISEAKEVPTTIPAMKACLAEGFPIIFGLKLTKKFFSPGPNGIIATPDPADPKSAEHGMHAMLVVGYSDNEQMFIVRNSWGEDWGDKGYCYVPYDYAGNEEFNFLGQYAIYGLTETDFTPEPTDEDEAPLYERTPDDDEEHDIEVEEEEVEEGDEEVDTQDLFDPRAEARKAFDMFDSDGSGSLNIRELNRALLLNGTFLRKRQLIRLMQQYDDDGTGTLDFEEFCSLPGVLP